MLASTTAVLGVLRRHRLPFAAGLRNRELEQIEAEFGFGFAPDHRDLLATALPVGKGWVDWRSADREEIQGRLDRPVEGMIFDVTNNAFWPRSWGRRPQSSGEAIAVARRHLASWPRLVPVYSHRYLAAAPAPAGTPVFSVHQSDVIYYGRDLVGYVNHEWGNDAAAQTAAPTLRVPGWSNLAEGAEDDEL